ncbi:MAG TPA: carboxymuconolactone decarboxylase family protein [Thermoanaerobaculia bacterium]|nr:carboxymuconolactone decarboxylase family protein [Thermoanaerobaculia bacterium]
MSRIPLVGRSAVTGAAREAFDRKIAERGNIPNMYRAFAHRPWLLTTMDAHFAAVMGSGTVPVKLKEMLALQTSLENASRYCAASHTTLAERTGSTKDQIAALRDFESGPFTEREKAALRFGLQMTRDANRIPDATWAALREHFAEAEVVELASVVGLFAYFNRFNNALGLEPTRAGEGADS